MKWLIENKDRVLKGRIDEGSEEFGKEHLDVALRFYLSETDHDNEDMETLQTRREAKAIMFAGDQGCHDSQLSITEVRSYLAGSQFHSFGEWLMEDRRRRFKDFDVDHSHALSIREVEKALHAYKQETGAKFQLELGDSRPCTAPVPERAKTEKLSRTKTRPPRSSNAMATTLPVRHTRSSQGKRPGSANAGSAPDSIERSRTQDPSSAGEQS
jgi:hypothetical protein